MRYPGPSLPPRPTAAQRKAHAAAFAKWVAEEEARVSRQRAALAAWGPVRARGRLVKAMIDRAWDLLDAGEAEAADALLEFVPEPVATALLEAFFPETDE